MGPLGQSVLTDYEEVEGIKLDQLIPMRKHVLVRWLHKEESKGHIILPQDRQRKGYMRGVVLRQGETTGPNLEGLTVMFDGLAEKEFLGPQEPGNRDTVFFMREEDIFAVVEESLEVSQ